MEAQGPQDVGELKSLLGLISYYSWFLPNIATMLAPLYQLLRKESGGAGLGSRKVL